MNEILFDELLVMDKSETEAEVIYETEQIPVSPVCPKCSYDQFALEGRTLRNVRDLNDENGRKVSITIYQQRFQCLNCHSVYKMPLKSVGASKRFTNRFYKAVQDYYDKTGVVNQCVVHFGLCQNTIDKMLTYELSEETT